MAMLICYLFTLFLLFLSGAGLAIALLLFALERDDHINGWD